jgi:outer membrane lipoprotein-sorting protein
MRKLAILAALLIAATAHAQSLDDVVSNVMKEYGGEAAWQKVTSLRESGTVVPMMRKGDGKVTRFWQKPDKLRFDVTYPTEREVRVVDGDRGTRNDKEVTGGSLDAMKLQAARLALPLLLVEKHASLHDLGTKDGVRTVEIPLSASLTLTVTIDVKTSHILRSTGKASGLEFVVDYSDFRRVNGLLFPFTEAGMAQGMPTANTKLDTIEINAPSSPPPPAAK